jgi:hypothetical protein
MPFFEFIEPPSFRESAILRDILPRDIASMPEVQLREYFRSKGLNNKDTELVITARKTYKYSEVSLSTNRTEIVNSLSHLSRIELTQIIEAEIKLADVTGDYSLLETEFIDIAGKMADGKIEFVEVNSKEFLIHKAKIESIMAEAKVVSKVQRDNIIFEGGEFCVYKNKGEIRYDINGKTFKESLQKVSEITGIDIKSLEEVYLTHETVIIGEYEFKLDGEKTGVVEQNLTPEQKVKLAKEKKINVVNYTIYKSGKYYGKFSVHDAGHSTMTWDKNATLPHLNYTLTAPRFEIDGHIFYKL